MNSTPGPWEVIGGPVSGTWHVATAYDDGGHVAALEARAEESANARLIAAAPRMADYILLHAERDPEARAILKEAGVLQ